MTQTLTQPETTHPDNSWYWPHFDAYRDPQGRTLEEAENEWLENADLPPDQIAEIITKQQWKLSPKPESDTRFMLQVMEAFFNPIEPLTYFEFGTCFGTTITTVLRKFSCARGIGLEVNPARYDVSRWIGQQVCDEFDLTDRLDLRNCSLTEAKLKPNSIDVVFMDTNHRYPDDYQYICHLLGSGALREGFLFLGDDPMHSGTDQARKQFISEQSDNYRIITRPDKNLWWFTAR